MIQAPGRRSSGHHPSSRTSSPPSSPSCWHCPGCLTLPALPDTKHMGAKLSLGYGLHLPRRLTSQRLALPSSLLSLSLSLSLTHTHSVCVSLFPPPRGLLCHCTCQSTRRRADKGTCTRSARCKSTVGKTHVYWHQRHSSAQPKLPDIMPPQLRDSYY